MLMRALVNRVAWFQDPPAGPAGGGGGTTTVVAAAPVPAPASREVAACIARYGGAEQAVGVLLADNAGLRKYRRLANKKATIDEVRAIIPEGTQLLTKEEAAELAAFKLLGKPDEVKKKIDASEKLQGELEETRKKTNSEAAAESLGWNKEALVKVVDSEKLHVELRDEQVDGKPVKKAYVRKADAANEPLVALADYAEKHLTVFLPSLKAATENGASSTNGVVFPHQTSSSTKPVPKGGFVEQFQNAKQEKEKKTVNPLTKK